MAPSSKLRLYHLDATAACGSLEGAAFVHASLVTEDILSWNWAADSSRWQYKLKLGSEETGCINMMPQARRGPTHC